MHALTTYAGASLGLTCGKLQRTVETNTVIQNHTTPSTEDIKEDNEHKKKKRRYMALWLKR